MEICTQRGDIVALSDTWLKANNGKQMLKWGVKREIISVNPLTGINVLNHASN